MNTRNLFNSKDATQPATDVTVKTEEITLSNQRKATAVFPTPTDKAEDIIAAMNLPSYKAVFLNLGSPENFDEKLMPRLIQLFSRGIATAALEAEALIVDGGVQAGVMSLMGNGVADRGYNSILVGITPANEVSYRGGPTTGAQLDPNHSHFILIEKDSSNNGLATMSDMVGLLINKTEIQNGNTVFRKVPALGILTGGNETTKEMLLQAVRQNINIIIIEGSGGLADEVAAALLSETPPEEPAMAEIIADGKLLVQSLTDPIPKIKKDILSRLGVDNVLMQAWETFADYDLNANIQQKKFDKIQQAIIFIGVVGTALAIIQQVMKASIEKTLAIAANAAIKVLPSLAMTATYHTLYVLLIIIPIVLTILITIVNRFKQGNKWLLLRAAAEAIKREIFRYRTRTNDYSSAGEIPVIPAQQLSKAVEVITTRTMRTEVNSSYLIRYDKSKGFPPNMYGAKGGDDGFSNLSPDRYIEVRLGDQLNYFQRRSIRLGKQLSLLSVTSFIIGGIGTFLAAINQPIWIALTTTLVAAIGTYLAYRQTENTLTKYNQTATNLTNVKAWWIALTPKEQLLQENINTLVEHTEQVLQVELDGWIQQMQNALAELRKNQETKPEVNENKPAQEKAKEPDVVVKENAAETPAEETPVVEAPAEPPVDEKAAEPVAEAEAPEEPVAEERVAEAPQPETENADDIDAGEASKIVSTSSTFVQPPAAEPAVEQVAIPFDEDKKV